MAKPTGYEDPLPLDKDTIDEHVSDNKKGTYVLGDMQGGEFKPKYVGRSVTDLNRRLKEQARKRDERMFVFREQRTKGATKKEEKRLIQTYGPKLDNKTSSARRKKRK